ncbi:MAG: hypothetical protein ACOY6N_10860 [Pseudomonadota bacterium]|uniref:hypothetical protein n=1 Tax=Sulfuricystis thermophila TaxID=2496847 RepID=UPI0024DF82BA|nr:hypothetical protein [Sulfuricystis thermophila]
MLPRKSLLVDAAMILALILIGAIGYKLSPLLLPKADLFVQPDAGCDLHRAPCTASLPGGGRLSFSLSPRPIPVATPLDVEVALEGLEAERVKVDFAGVEMSMGYNRPTLRAITAQRHVGQATLPVCVTGRMLWQATVLVESGGQRIAVPFRFEAGH